MLGLFGKSARVALSRGRARFSSGSQAATEVSALANGMRVATTRTPDESVTFGLWINSGSRFETAQTNGAAHFLEHLFFKGTKRRTRVQLETEIEHMGAHLNAYTAREQTVYYFKCMKSDMSKCADILSDIMLNSTISQADIENEKHVILREHEEVEKSTDEVIFDNLHATAFRDNSLGFPILGSTDNIKNMQRSYLTDYIAQNYHPDRMVLVAAGNVSHKEVHSIAEKYFGIMPKSKIIIPKLKKPHFVGSEILYRNDDMGPTAHVAVGFQGVPWTSGDSVAFMLMQTIIGSYKKGEEGLVAGKISGNNTIHRVATKMNVGCADMFTGFNTCYSDTGLFGFYAQCDEVAVDHTIGELMFGITALSHNISEEEVHRAKLTLKTQLCSSLDSTTAIAEDIGRHILAYGRRVPLLEFYQRIDAIDAEEIKRVAWKYLHDSEVAVVGLGPLHSMPQYIEIRKMTYWLRY